MTENPVSARLRGLTNNITLVGADDQIKTQLSLLFGIAQIGESQLKGLDINFEKFITDFEHGFTNAFARPENKLYWKYWGQLQQTRPKIRVLAEINPQSENSWTNQGFYLIELQPNRKIEDESYMLFGTPSTLIPQIIGCMNDHLKTKRNNEEIDSLIAAIERETRQVDLREHPKVKLIFLENIYIFSSRVAKNSDAKRGAAQISFRLMNKTAASITKGDVLQLANNIKQKFVNPRFKFTKGKELYSYLEPKIGDKLYCWAKNQQNAQKVFEQVLDLVGENPSQEKTRKHVSLAPQQAYNDAPGTEMVLGERVRKERLRPVVEVEFVKAYLTVNGLRKPFHLIDTTYKHKGLVSPD